MIVKDIYLINKDIEARERNRMLRKFLPILLLLSFAWLGLFENYSAATFEVLDYFKLNMLNTDPSITIIFNIIALSLISWLWFEIILYVYKMLVAFSVFSYTIPKALLENNAKIFMVIRNIVLGVFMNMLFFFPYLINFVLIVELVIDFLMFGLFFMSVTRETVSIMIAPNVLRTYFNAFAFIETIHILIYVLGVL